jgi:hypothetical protein
MCPPRCAETGAGAIWRFIRSSEIGKELDWGDDEESDRAEAPARQQQQKQRKKREDGAALPAAAMPAPCPATYCVAALLAHLLAAPIRQRLPPCCSSRCSCSAGWLPLLPPGGRYSFPQRR